MSSSSNQLRCSDVAPLLVFYVCNELTSEERTAIDSHLASCAGCRTQLAEETFFNETLAAMPQPAEKLDTTGALLSQCRSELAESLDEISAPPVREGSHIFGWVRGWMALRPAWSAAALLICGAIVGTQLVQWLPGNDPRMKGTAMNVLAAPKLSQDQLEKMSIGGINFRPSPDAAPGMLQVRLKAEQPLVLSGNVDDTDMRQVLTYVVKNGERFDLDLRLDCVDVLRERASDEEVRAALVQAVYKDQNPAVRMKALEALRDVTSENEVREALLNTLQHDNNPGVRVEAVNLLVRSLEEALEQAPDDPEPAVGDAPVVAAMPPQAAVPPVPAALPAQVSVKRVVRVLDELRRNDPSRYVRLRSAAALRQISAREEQ